MYGNQKVGLVFLLKNSGEMGLTAYTTPTVRDIFFICRFLFGLSTFLSLYSCL